jgi:hypothetical protein
MCRGGIFFAFSINIESDMPAFLFITRNLHSSMVSGNQNINNLFVQQSLDIPSKKKQSLDII